MPRFSLHLLMALLTFILGVSIAALGYLRPTLPGAPERPVSRQSLESPSTNLQAWQVLLSFEGRDLRNLDRESADRLRRAIEALLGNRSAGEHSILSPRLVSKLSNGQGQIRYALIEEYPLLTIPGRSRIYAHVFDGEGGLLSSSDFNGGHRIFLTGMEVTYSPEIGREILVVNSQPAINGADIARQYYALVGEQILLIRLEDSGGRLVRNTYSAPGHTIGVTLTGRSAEEWVSALKSSDVAEVLATLTWLSGTHLNPRKPEPDYSHEEMREARLADKVRSREAVRTVLDTLTQSGNAWVRSGAELTKTVEYNR